MIRPRYRQEVAPEHVGSRVSIRRWVTDPDRGPVPSDVVGRLITWSDDDHLEVRKRDGTLVSLDAADILASRVVPEHPRLPPEPHD